MIVLGQVAVFDDRRGDGVVRTSAGEEFPFHCVSIADGTRQIDEGTEVRATRCVGLLGRDEVTEVEKVSDER